MQLSIGKLLSVIILCVLSLSHVKAATKVTVTDFYVDVPDNELIESWSTSLTDNLISSQIHVKQACPGEVEADITVYKGDDIVSQKNKKFDKPMTDFENYDICETIETPDLEDDSCSIPLGEQVATNCDVSDWFSSMKPGDYVAKSDFKENDKIVATVTMNVKVEAEQ